MQMLREISLLNHHLDNHFEAHLHEPSKKQIDSAFDSMTGTLKFPPTFCLKNQEVERKLVVFWGVPFFWGDVDHLVFELGSIPKKTC